MEQRSGDDVLRQGCVKLFFEGGRAAQDRATSGTGHRAQGSGQGTAHKTRGEGHGFPEFCLPHPSEGPIAGTQPCGNE